VAAWTDERVWDAADAGRWIPPGATRITTESYDVAVTPGSYALTFVYGFHVEPAERVPEVLVELRERIRALGGNGARILVSPRTRPRDLADRLPSLGYEPREETEVLVRELAEPRPPSAAGRLREGIEVREVRTEAEYGSYLAVSDEVFGHPPNAPSVDAAFLAEFRRAAAAGEPSGRWVAWAGATPVGAGGFSLDGPVARLWGAGVLPAYRRRGVYGALVAARCAAARARGAEIALVSARVQSSAPILLRHGFRSVGSTRQFEARF
jgi:GNAT superfamily N-acetyltransferase